MDQYQQLNYKISIFNQQGFAESNQEEALAILNVLALINTLSNESKLQVLTGV
jgi:hypothetical protein